MNKLVLDLSEHNGYVDMVKVKNSGVYGIIQRVGYGTDTIDKTAKRNIDNALKEGLKVGCYWFMYSLNIDQAKQEALNFNRFLEQYRGKLELPVCCDFEYDTERYAKQCGVHFTNRDRTDMITVFCKVLESKGWYVCNYGNIDYINNKWYQSELDMLDLWLAYWGSNPPGDLISKSSIWQYSSTGTVNGIYGNVDMNELLIDVPVIIKENNLNGFNNGNNTIVDNSNDDYITLFAKDVIDGIYGNGKERERLLYITVQNEVNNILSGDPLLNNHVTEFAKEVIKGTYGNGTDRMINIYNTVQEKVNTLV